MTFDASLSSVYVWGELSPQLERALGVGFSPLAQLKKPFPARMGVTKPTQLGETAYAADVRVLA
jgi:hypothetical protein